MPNRYYSIGTRDANEGEFLKLLQRTGIKYRQLDKNVGADLLILSCPMEFWEIKNPKQPPSKRKLTNSELETQAHCRELGIPYLIFEHVEDAAERINKLRVEP